MAGRLKIVIALMALVFNGKLYAENLLHVLSLDVTRHIANYNLIKDQLTDSTALIYIEGVDTVHAINNRTRCFYIVTAGIKKTNFHVKYICFPDGFSIPVVAGYGSFLRVNANAFQILCNKKRLKDYFQSESSFYSFGADLIVPIDYRIYTLHSKIFLNSTKQEELKNMYDVEIKNATSVKQENAFVILFKDYKYNTRQPLFLLYFYDGCRYKFTIDHKITDINDFIGNSDARMGPLISWKW